VTEKTTGGLIIPGLREGKSAKKAEIISVGARRAKNDAGAALFAMDRQSWGSAFLVRQMVGTEN